MNASEDRVGKRFGRGIGASEGAEAGRGNGRGEGRENFCARKSLRRERRIGEGNRVESEKAE